MAGESTISGPPTLARAPAASEVAPPDREVSRPVQRSRSAHVLQCLSDVAEVVRAGTYPTTDDDDVLVDIVIGSTRCVLLVHEPSVLVRLTPREQEVARMVAVGRTNQAIAGALDISVWTVSSHLRRIFAKLAVSSRTEMVTQLLSQRALPGATTCPPSNARGPGRARLGRSDDPW